MFKAIRGKLADGWVKLKQENLFHLFLFEFVVVMLGVLAAQGLANWVADRQQIREVEAEKARLDQRVVGARSSADKWLAAIPCLDSKLAEIMVAAAEGTTPDTRALQRPVFWGTQPPHMTEEMEVLLRDQYGQDRVDLYLSMIRALTNSENFTARIADEWSRLSRLDPANGPVGEADRIAARDAASILRSQLRSLSIAGQNIVSRTDQFGIRAEPSDRRPARNCEEIWVTSNIGIPVEEAP